MPRPVEHSDYPMADVFTKQGAICPEHKVPLVLHGLHSETIGTSDAVIEIEMKCYSGRHNVTAKLLMTNGLIHFKVQYRDWDPPVRF